MDKVNGILRVFATVITLFISCILLAGYVYHLGYSLTFGLSPELMVKTLAEMLTESWYLGVKLLTWLLSKWWYLIVIGFFFLLVLIGIFLYVLHSKGRGQTWFTDEITKHNQGGKFWGLTQWYWKCLWQLYEDVASWILLPLIVLLFGVILTVFPFVHGKNEALKQITEHQLYGCEAKEKIKDVVYCNYLIDITGGQEKLITQGILVFANDHHIALFDNDKLEVWPLLDSYIIRRHVKH